MIIGVCGYGFSGTGALYSLLKEYDNVYTLPGARDIEYIISYTADGLEDLEYHLCKNPVKGLACDSAIYRFQLLINDLERRHNRYTNNKFREISNNYIDSIVQIQWKAFRLFEFERRPGRIKRIEKTIRSYIQFKLKKFGISYIPFRMTQRYLSIDPEGFVEKTRIYINNLLGHPNSEKILMLNQPFSPTNPLNGMKFFENSICIIVDRDPRDLYVMAKHVYGSRGLFIPTDTVEHFVIYYKTIRSRRLIQDSEKVLFVQFEDLVYHYDDEVNRIHKFIGSSLGKNVNKNKYFDPRISIENTHVYMNFPEDKEDIEYIESELNEWLYKFDEEDVPRKNNDLTKFTFM